MADSRSPGEPDDIGRVPQRASGSPSRWRLTSRLRRVGRHAWVRRWLPAALLTCVVALYNHFPLTYPDAGNYILNAYDLAHGQRPWFFFRPLTYGLLLVPFATPYTLWLLPLAQGFLVAVVVDLALRGAAVSLSCHGFLLLFAGLSAFTSLPWFSGQVMPDILTSVVILLSYVTLWGEPKVSGPEQWVAGGLLSFAVASHLSHFPLFGMLLIAGLAGRAIIDPAGCWRRFVPLALRASAPLAVAVAMVVGPNYFLHGELVLSRSSSLFALAHLVGDSLAQRYLDRACAIRRYMLCGERSNLHGDVDRFLWDPAGGRLQHEPALRRGDSTFLREAPDIVLGTLRQEWPAVIQSSLRNGVVQLGAIGADPGDHGFSASVERAMERLGPAMVRAYAASGQVRGALPLQAASFVQYTGVAVGLLVLLVCLPGVRGRAHRPVQALISTVGLGLVINALVVASLAMVHPRYQSRVVWLVPLAAVAAAVQLRSARNLAGRGGGRTGATA